MNNFFRAIIAGYGAKKLGGGCLGTVLVFIVIWVALGQCSWAEPERPPLPKFKRTQLAHIITMNHSNVLEIRKAA
jgi:hypothetical protein